jgi:hypothetical protein
MDPVSGGALPLAPAAVGGRRHHKKLRLVTKKVARKALKKMGLKIRGGAAAAAPESAPVAVPEEVAKMGGADMAETPAVPAAAVAGRRRKSKKTRRHSRRSIFGY